MKNITYNRFLYLSREATEKTQALITQDTETNAKCYLPKLIAILERETDDLQDLIGFEKALTEMLKLTTIHKELWLEAINTPE